MTEHINTEFVNATGLYVPTGIANSGENIGLTDSSVFNNQTFGIDDHGNFEWMISGSAFDSNGTAVEFFGASFHSVNCHFEQNGGQVIFQPYGRAVLSVKYSMILVQNTSGAEKSSWMSGHNLSSSRLTT